MNKTILLLVFLSILIHSKTFAQSSSTSADGGIKIVDLLRTTNSQNQIAKDIAGSPYLSEEWQKAKIETTNNQELEVHARYRYYDNVVEIKKGADQNIYALGMNQTKSITIGDEHFVVIKYQTKEEEIRMGFFELLTDGQFRLLIEYGKVLTKAVNNGYQNTPAEINAIRNFLVYDQIKKEMIPLKKLGKKSILPLFGKYSKKVEDYAKKNKLSFKKVEGLTKIFEYYNLNHPEK